VTAVSDSGPLIHLSWLNQPQLLPALFGDVAVPTAVRNEVLQDEPGFPGIAELRNAFAEDWIQVRTVSASPAGTVALPGLGAGESEAMALMVELAADVLLMDERRGRRYASQQGLPLVGTIGVLRLARGRGLVPAVSPLLEQLRERGFRIGTHIVEQVNREEQTQR